MRELDRQEGQPGADLQLSVDADLQQYAQARLAGESAAAVVIDCETGDHAGDQRRPPVSIPICSCAASLSRTTGSLTQDKYRPLANKTVQGTYPPGSTFKMITALAALEAGVIGPGNTVYCPGHLKVGSRRFHCWKRGGHGMVDLNTVAEAQLRRLLLRRGPAHGHRQDFRDGAHLRAGRQTRYPDVRRRGRAGPQSGLETTGSWRGLADRRHGQRLDRSGFHAGLAAATGGHDGTDRHRARGHAASGAVGRTAVEQPSGAGEPLAINPNNLEYIRKAMFSVSNDRRGTAYRSRIIADEFRMAGKTGTSQVRNITKAERAAGVIRNEDLPWERRDHALFVSFAPYDNPKYAVAVVVEHGGGGSKAAAPVARDIMLAGALQRHTAA